LNKKGIAAGMGRFCSLDAVFSYEIEVLIEHSTLFVLLARVLTDRKGGFKHKNWAIATEKRI
jgi:hypothetical protein